MEYLRCIFQIFLLSNFAHFARSTDVKCVSNCVVDGAKNIIGGEGEEIELKYTINFDYASFVLYFNKTIIARIFEATNQYTLVLTPHPLINFNGTSLSQDKKSLAFKILPLKRLLKGVILESIVSATDPSKGGKDSHTLLVKFGPDIIIDVKSTYEVSAGNGVAIPLTLLGYPKPTVTAAGVPLSISDATTTATDTYEYVITVPTTDKSDCGKTVSVQASGFKSVALTSAVLNVVFEPSTPEVTLSTFNHTSCLHVQFNEIESGQCVVEYIVTYEYVNGTSGNKEAIATSTTSSPLHTCFKPDTYHNGTVAISAKVGDKVGAKSSKVTVKKIEKPTTPAPVTEPPTGSSQIGNDNTFEWYFILIIVLAIVLLILIIICVCLCCTGKIACGICEACGKGKNTKKLNSVRAQNGISNPHYQMHSVEDLEVAAGLKPPPKSEGAYAEIGGKSEKAKETPVVDYAQPDTLDKTLTEPASIYAELGPGGREGEKPQLEPSLYAQVNTDDAYYPPLNPDNPEPPVYAISTKKNPDLLVQVQDEKFDGLDATVVSQGSMLPPSEYEDDGMNPVTV